jgi:hypothetical protein
MIRFKKVLSLLMTAVFLFAYLTQSVSAAQTAGLEFVDNNKNLKKGSQTDVDIRVLPRGNRLIGVDLIITYDPEYIKVTDISDLGVFNHQYAEIIDNDKGVLKTAFSNNFGNFQTANKIFANLKFEVKDDGFGKTYINFKHQPGNTTDTNLAGEGGQDLLAEVNSLEVTYQNGAVVVSAIENRGEAGDNREDAEFQDKHADTEILSNSDEEVNKENLLDKIAEMTGSQKKNILGVSDEMGSSGSIIKYIAALLIGVFLGAAFWYTATKFFKRKRQ